MSEDLILNLDILRVWTKFNHVWILLGSVFACKYCLIHWYQLRFSGNIFQCLCGAKCKELELMGSCKWLLKTACWMRILAHFLWWDYEF